MTDLFTMVGASFMLVMGIMTVCWFIYLFQRNAGIVDIGWTLGFIATQWAYFFLGSGDLLKRCVLTGMVTVWGARLAWHLFQRFLRTPEDPRYVEMRKQWGKDFLHFKIYGMFLFQGLIVMVLTVPFLIVSAGAESEWSLLEGIGILLWIAGVAGESLADKQLMDFKKLAGNAGKICQEGLWRFSRHPNYFFEFIVWVGYFLFAFASPWGWFAVVAPALMLALLLGLSGIPLNEAESLRTKGDAYREYQRTTSPFIPWFRKG